MQLLWSASSHVASRRRMLTTASLSYALTFLLAAMKCDFSGRVDGSLPRTTESRVGAPASDHETPRAEGTDVVVVLLLGCHALRNDDGAKARAFPNVESTQFGHLPTACVRALSLTRRVNIYALARVDAPPRCPSQSRPIFSRVISAGVTVRLIGLTHDVRELTRPTASVRPFVRSRMTNVCAASWKQ